MVFATHNRAGYITYHHLSNLTFQITVTTYTDPNSPADRPYLPVDFGDGSTDSVARNQVVPINSQVQKNIYITTHTYTGSGAYIISVTDPNRTANSQNIPNSVDVPFYIQTQLTISGFLGGYDDSPVIHYPPIDNGCTGQIYQYNPGATDADGDSLAYFLHVPMEAVGSPALGYTYPQVTTIDHITGLMTWNQPTIQGNYNIDIEIKEYRNGVYIGYVLEDMQITIGACNNHPPVITCPDEFCVLAGDTVSFYVQATDPDGDNSTISAEGAPFDVSVSPAYFNPPQVAMPSVTGHFYWQTACAHVRKQVYKATFKAVDIGSPNQLAYYKSTSIRVVGPPVTLSVAPQGSAIQLDWSESPCPQAVKYYIYRRQGPSGWNHGQCETGVPAYTGFVKIAETNSLTDTTYLDDNNGVGLISGDDYCYRVVAVYPDGAESYASNEACAVLKRDMPIITNVSVDSTATSTGRMFVVWAKPTEIDTNEYPGPYRYLIYRGLGQNVSLIDSTNSIIDTTYEDTLLNTKSLQYTYRVDIYNLTNGTHDLIGKSTLAKSIYLTNTPTDKKLILSWSVDVPWTNSSYIVYRENAGGTFDSIATVTGTTYTDSGLVNGNMYCYKIKSIGQYSAPGLPAPLINYSQINCGIPIDNIPPCPPLLTINSSCEDFENTLQWTGVSSCSKDVSSYKIYYTTDPSKDMVLLATVTSPEDTVYVHKDTASIAGCYAVSAVDSAGNESKLSDSVCVDNCPEYHLPNVFTPGKDGINDFFIPFPYRYVDRIDLTIYNRWGNVVFQTHDPDINWDGTDKDSGKLCSDGVYFYVCIVYEKRLEGIQTKVLKGNIELLSN